MKASPGPACVAARGDGPHDDVVHPSPILFVAAHFACLAAVWTGQSGVMAGTDNRGCEDDRDLSPSGQRHARHHGPCLM